MDSKDILVNFNNVSWNEAITKLHKPEYCKYDENFIGDWLLTKFFYLLVNSSKKN